MFLQNVQNCSGSHPCTYSVGTVILSLRVNEPTCYVNRLPPSSAEARNEWSCTCASPTWLHDLVRGSYNFICVNHHILVCNMWYFHETCYMQHVIDGRLVIILLLSCYNSKNISKVLASDVSVSCGAWKIHVLESSCKRLYIDRLQLNHHISQTRQLSLNVGT